MVGDAALLHYAVFLIRHGWAPYRDFVDVNMPGAYWITAVGMSLPWQPDLGWRLFDLGLVLITAAAFYAIARPYSRFAALFAGALLLLVHGQDGVQQAGQRDLAIAALLMAGTACLLIATRRGCWIFLIPFGVAVGLAATIKPTAAPFGLVLLGMVAINRLLVMPGSVSAFDNNHRRPWGAFFLWIIAGGAAMVLPLVGMLLWLKRMHALSAWIHAERVLLPFYASFERRPFAFTLSHSISPLLPLVLLWLGCCLLGGPKWPRFERLAIGMGAALNLFALLAQGKALPYQRYPMLVFLLLLIGIDLTTAVERRDLARPWVRHVAFAGLGFGCLIVAPLALLRVSHFSAQTQQFDAMLRADLDHVRLPRGENLNGRVQCLDTIEDCLPTLFSMHLLPASGILSDLLLFPPPAFAQQPAVREAQQRFEQAAATNPPVAIVAVSGYYLNGNDGYGKLARWPAFQRWLSKNYTLKATGQPRAPIRWWGRAQTPAGYRLYVLRVSPTDGANESRAVH